MNIPNVKISIIYTNIGYKNTQNPNIMAVTAMAGGVIAHIIDDKEANHFGDFEHLVDFEITYAEDSSLCMVWGISDNSYTWNAMRNNDEGLSVLFASGGTGTKSFTLKDSTTDTEDAMTPLPTLNTPYYLTIERATTTLTCKIYDDSDRANLVDTLTIVCTSDTYSHIIAVGSMEWPAYTGSQSGTINNLDLQEVLPP
ncbi:unnamed protein product, partial [marine sediment metagenome]